MKRARRNGFTILLALMCLSLVGAAVVILAATSRDLLFESDRAYVEAYSRNLTASALTWADVNRKKIEDMSEGKELRLDVEGLDIPDASLRLAPLQVTDEGVKVGIAIECRRNKTDLKRSNTYITGAVHLSTREQTR